MIRLLPILLLLAFPVYASQNDMSIANASGATVRADINSALQALASNSKGNSRPSTAYAGQFWLDDNTPSSTVWTLNLYDGSDDIPAGYFDSTNNLFVPLVGGGTATIASAGTTDLGGSPQAAITVSGTTTITSFGSSAPTGTFKFVTFSGALTLTHNGTSLILPGGVNITTAAGDMLIAQALGSGNWRVLSYVRGSGEALLNYSMFSARASAGTAITATDYTKVQFGTEDYDIGSVYDAATNYRFTAPVTGKYLINGLVTLDSVGADKIIGAAIYVNGSLVKQSLSVNGSVAGSVGADISAILSLSATDYVELFAYNGDSSNRNINTSAYSTHFSAHRLP